MAKSSETFCRGASIDERTITRSTRAADGIGATENDAANEVKITVIISPMPRLIELICAMKIADVAQNNAVPSMLSTPMGSMNRVIRLSIFNFCSMAWNVRGRAAVLGNN